MTHEVRYEDEGLRLWSSRELLVAAWFEAPTLERMREVARIGKALGSETGAGAAFANVIVSGVPRFSDDVREEGIRIARERTFRRGSCHVVLATGLGGAAARAFMSMVLLVGRRALGARAAPTKVFGDIGEAGAWLAAILDESWTATEVRELLRASAHRVPPQ